MGQAQSIPFFLMTDGIGGSFSSPGFSMLEESSIVIIFLGTREKDEKRLRVISIFPSYQSGPSFP